jgi:predicted metal-dependent HD superfamily phosphohydrolase
MKDSFEVIEKKIIARLNSELDPRLYYHNSHHTKDVVEQTERIAKREGIYDDETLRLLKIAALYHDTGFIYTYNNHEQKGCEIVREDLLQYDFADDEVETIAELIMSTKVPQQPKSHLQEIICDADLDYLGRGDYNEISCRLKKELFEYGCVSTEKDWLLLQINFLENHTYFTATSKENRSDIKGKVLADLKQRLNHLKS